MIVGGEGAEKREHAIEDAAVRGARKDKTVETANLALRQPETVSADFVRTVQFRSDGSDIRNCSQNKRSFLDLGACFPQGCAQHSLYPANHLLLRAAQQRRFAQHDHACRQRGVFHALRLRKSPATEPTCRPAVTPSEI